MALLQCDSWLNERLFRLEAAAKPSQGLSSPTFKTRSEVPALREQSPFGVEICPVWA